MTLYTHGNIKREKQTIIDGCTVSGLHKMSEFSSNDDSDSENDDFLDNNNELHRAGYILDINYSRPLKHFPSSLNKIEEVDETSIKSSETSRSKEQDENGNIVDDEKSHRDSDNIEKTSNTKERPRSASSVDDRKQSQKHCFEGRSQSSCADYSRIFTNDYGQTKVPAKTRSDSESSSNISIEREGKRPRSAECSVSKHKSNETCWENFYIREEEANNCEFWISEYPIRPKSACNVRRHMDSAKCKRARRSNSQPNISSNQPTALSNSWSDISRFKRSLRLLGLSQSDFGLPESPKHYTPPRPKSCHNISPTFQTRVLQRSVSLEFLREVIRKSAHCGYSGLPERQLLVTAAYEEWYFKKSKEIRKKLIEEQEKKDNLKSFLEEQMCAKREKAQEKFKLWISRKKKTEKDKNENRSKMKTIDARLTKSKEEVEKAYQEWKKAKQKDLDKKREHHKAKAERDERLKSEKEEKKLQAEKIFQEWKKKLEEKRRVQRQHEAAAKERMKQQLRAKQKSKTSFEAWKNLKDDEIKEKLRKVREEGKLAEVRRTIIVTERMYEAEQAYDEWLERVDSRQSNGKQIESKISVQRTSA